MFHLKVVKEWVDLTEKNNKFVTIVNYVILGVIALFAMVVLAVAYNYRGELKDISKLSKMAKSAQGKVSISKPAVTVVPVSGGTIAFRKASGGGCNNGSRISVLVEF